MDLIRRLRGRQLVSVCPEQLGGLPTPREPAEIQGGDGQDVLSGRARVRTARGRDLTDSFLRGARETLRIARECGCVGGLLKSRSPSCGVHQHYDGTFTGTLQPGPGVTAALLRRHDIVVAEAGQPEVRPGE